MKRNKKIEKCEHNCGEYFNAWIEERNGLMTVAAFSAKQYP
jgi:hypothetical protein